MTRALRIVVVLALLAPWLAAVLAWPDLPERIPMHFDVTGQPVDQVDRTALLWFLLPAVSSLLGALIGLALPVWVVRMARANSRWLNVPNRARFRELPEHARERAVAVPAAWLSVLAIELQLVFVWLLRAMHAIATQQKERLSAVPASLLIGVLAATVVAFGVHGHRALKKELERARAANA